MHVFGSVGARAAGGQKDRLRLAELVRLGSAQEVVENVAGYGRWWYQRSTGTLALSESAAQALQVDAGVHASLDDAFMAVVQDDLSELVQCLEQHPSPRWEQEFRVVSALDGVRWVRMQAVPELMAAGGICSGIVRDVSVLKMAAMREGWDSP
jgi:hypothetical protein